MRHEVLRIAAFLLMAAAVYNVVGWERLSKPHRYLAVVILGTAFVFYHYFPTKTACEQEEDRTGAIVCDDSGY